MKSVNSEADNRSPGNDDLTADAVLMLMNFPTVIIKMLQLDGKK